MKQAIKIKKIKKFYARLTLLLVFIWHSILSFAGCLYVQGINISNGQDYKFTVTFRGSTSTYTYTLESLSLVEDTEDCFSWLNTTDVNHSSYGLGDCPNGTVATIGIEYQAKQATNDWEAFDYYHPTITYTDAASRQIRSVGTFTWRKDLTGTIKFKIYYEQTPKFPDIDDNYSSSCADNTTSYTIKTDAYFDENCDANNGQLFVNSYLLADNLKSEGETVTFTNQDILAAGVTAGQNITFTVTKQFCNIDYWGTTTISSNTSQRYKIVPNPSFSVSAPALCASLPGYTDTSIIISGLTAGEYILSVKENSSTSNSDSNYNGTDLITNSYNKWEGNNGLTLTPGTTYTVGIEKETIYNEDTANCETHHDVTIPLATETHPSDPDIDLDLSTLIFCPVDIVGTIQTDGESGGEIYTLCDNAGNELSYTLNTSDAYTGLGEGQYKVRASLSGCYSYSNTVTIMESNPELTAKATSPTCHSNNKGLTNDGTVTLKIANGKAPYKYEIDGGRVISNSTNLESISFDTIVTANLTYLVTDACGLPSTDDAQVFEPATEITISTGGVTYDNCYGSFSAFASQNGTSIPDPDVVLVKNGTDTIVPNITRVGGKFTKLSAGYYLIKATSGSCYHTKISPHIAYAKPKINIADSVDVICHGSATGSITISGITVGSELIDWRTFDGANFSTNSTYTKNNLSPGKHEIIATDYNECADTVKIWLDNPDNGAFVFVGVYVTDQVCEADSNGKVRVVVDGGWSGDRTFTLTGNGNTYTITKNSNIHTFENLFKGAYTVTVTDSRGCTISRSATVRAYNNPILTSNNYSVKDNTCWYGTDGRISVINIFDIIQDDELKDYFLKGVNISDYKKIDRNDVFNNLPAASDYSLYVTDQSDCPSNTINNIVVGAPDTISYSNNFPSIKHQTCQWSSDTMALPNGEITAAFKGGSASYDTIEFYQGISLDTGLFAGYAENLALPPFENLEPEQEYYFRVVDSKGCEYRLPNIRIKNYTNPVLWGRDMDSVMVKCYGDSNGVIKIKNIRKGVYNPRSPDSSLIGIKTIYNEWGNSAERTDVINLAPGFTYPIEIDSLPKKRYHLKVVDDNGCESKFASQDVEQPPELEVVNPIIRDSVHCKGGKDGRFEFEVSGGTLDYTDYSIYKLNEGKHDSTTNTQHQTYFNNLEYGEYYVVATDTNNCQANSDTLLVNEPTDTLTFSLSQDPVLCHRDDKGTHDDGTIKVTPTGGWSDYLFDIRHTDTSYTGSPVSDSNFSDLEYGLHYIQVTDKGGCVVENTITVEQPDQLDINENIFHEICAYTNTGKIEVEASGSHGDYKFVLLIGSSREDSFENVGINNKVVFENRYPSSNYKIQVRDQYECWDTTSFITIEEYVNPYLDFNDIDMFPVKCHGDSTGILSISNIIEGFNKNISPTIDIDTIFLHGQNNSIEIEHSASDTVFSDLPSDNYYIIVQDIKGCLDTALKFVSQPDSALHFNHIKVTDSVHCKGRNDGHINFSVGGGTLDYIDYSIFKLNEGKYDSINIQAQTYFTGLNYGEYYVVATDANDCQANSDTLLVNEPTDTLTFSLSQDPVLCHRDDKGTHDDGTIKVTPTGGWSDYLFDIRHTDTSYTGSPVSDSNFSDLEYGLHYIQVTDKGGCVVENTITVEQPDQLDINENIFHEICENTDSGKIEVTVNGSHPAYTFQLFNRGDTLINEFSNIGEDSNVLFTNLQPDQYFVKVTDSSSCYDSTALLEILQYENPILYLDSIYMDSVKCYGESNGILTVKDITEGYNDISYNVNKIFLKGLNTIKYNGIDTVHEGYPPNMIFAGLPADTFEIFVQDINNCYSNSIFPAVEEPDSLFIIIDTIQHVTCFNDKNGLIEYSYYGGNDTSYIPEIYWNSGLITADRINTTFQNLEKGTYALKIEDYKGCFATDTGFVDGPDTNIHITYETTLVDCHVDDNGEHVNGTISILSTADGYDPASDTSYAPYIYKLKHADSTDYSRMQTDTFFANLPVGIHTIQVIDKEGCENYTFPIKINSNDSLTFSVATFDEVCENTSSGKIEVSTFGGAGKHTYSLSSLDTSGFSSLPFFVDSNLNFALFTNLPPAPDYRVKATDTLGCSQIISNDLPVYEYFNPIIFEDSVWIDSVHCYGEANGTVQIRGAKGWHDTIKVPFTTIHIYDSNLNETTEPFTGFFNRNYFTKGNYIFELEDDSLCRSNKYGLVIEEPDTLIINLLDKQNVIGKGESSGIIEVKTSGGNPGKQTFTALRNNVDYNSIEKLYNTAAFEWNGFIAGNYTIRVSDYKNCTDTISNISIDEPDTALMFTVVSKNNALCKADIGDFTVEGIGGWGAYKFKGAKRQSYHDTTYFGSLYAGNYEVTVKDSMGATYTSRIKIEEPVDSLRASITDIQNPTCGDNGEITYQMNGGTVPYRLTYTKNDTFSVWSPYQYIAIDLAEGYYYTTVFDSNKCRYDVEATLNGDDRLQITNMSIENYVTTKTAPGNGSLKATVSGGLNNTFYWYSAEDTTTSIGSDTIITGLLAGLYQFKVTSARGCEQSKSIYLPHFYDTQLEIVEIGHETGYQNHNGYAIFKVPYNNPQNVSIKRKTEPEIICSISSDSVTYDSINHQLIIDELRPGNYIVLVSDTNQQHAYTEFVINAYEYFEIIYEEITEIARHDGSDGAIEVGCRGGGDTNTYHWESENNPGINLDSMSVNSDNGTNLYNLPAGDYSLTITDNYNYTLYGNYTLVNPPPIEITFNKNDALCKDSTDGDVHLTATGGWGSFQYKIDTGAHYLNENFILGLEARDYWFYVIDKRGVIDSVQVIIDEPEYLRSYTKWVDSVNCKGESNGIIYFGINGGTKPYAFKQLANSIWKPDSIASNLDSGRYVYHFRDSNYCPGIDTLTVYMPEPDSLLFASINVKHTTCDINNGSITVDLEGGTEPYNYLWNNSAGDSIGNTAVINNLEQSEQYYLRVTDYNNCLTKKTWQIKPSNAPSVDSLIINSVICYGDSTGSAKIAQASAGIPNAPYWFEWSNGDTGSISSCFYEGNHFVVIKDSNNCSTTRWFNVSQPDILEALVIDSMHASCYGLNNAFIKIKPRGGVGNYNFNWSNGDTLSMADSLYSGTYNLVLTDSNLCTLNKTYTINQPALLTSQVALVNNLLCKGDRDGRITFAIQGGTKPYKFKLLSDSLWLNNTIASYLSEGTYIYEFSDANECTGNDTLTVSITAPDSLLFETIEITHTTCDRNNGEISINMQGGTLPYSYQWTNTKGINIGSTPIIDSLEQLEQYNLIVTDSNNCIAKKSWQIQHSSVPRVDSIITQPVICSGDTTGLAEVTYVTAGYPYAPYWLEWSNGDMGNTSNRFYDGIHYVIITDTNGCSSTKYFTVSSHNPVLGNIKDFAEPVCYGDANGFFEAFAKGGVGNYSILWSNGDTLFKAENLPAGNYQYQITDSNGCTFNGEKTLNQPELVRSKIESMINNLLCAGDQNGNISFAVSGGHSPYYYKPVGSDTWIQNTNIYHLGEGIYNYAFKDNNNCISKDTVTVEITAPDSLLFKTIDVNHTTCELNNGEISVEMQGGVKPYSYLWTNISGDVISTTNYVSKLKQLGQYSLVVLDSNNCQNILTKQINSSSLPRTAALDIRPVLCYGDTTGYAKVAKVTYGVPYAPVNFKWSNNDIGEESNHFSNGDHYVEITDTNGCSSIKYFTVSSPDPVSGNIMNFAEPQCYDGSDGFLQAFARGGVGNYSILWSNGNASFKAENLAAGEYHYQISDSNGCIFNGETILSQPELLHSKIASVNNLACAGDRYGKVSFTLYGGTSPYYYKPIGADTWIQNTNIYQMGEGTYTYIFKDHHNCISHDTVTVEITAPDSLLFDYLDVQHTTCNEDNGSIFFTIKGGVPPYNYEWTNRYYEVLDTINFIDSLKQLEQYWLKVVDANGCEFKYEAQIEPSSGPYIEDVGTADVLCLGDSTGFAEVTGINYADPYSPCQVYWSNGDTGRITNNYPAGFHYATVVDSNGCISDPYPFNIGSPDSLWADNLDLANAQCYNYSNGYIYLQPRGGVGGYKALWSNGDTTFYTQNLRMGNYQFLLTDSNGCTYTKNFEITQPDTFYIDIGEDVQICPGSSYILDGLEFAGHHWTYNGSSYSTERYISISDEGTYNLVVTNRNGCHSSDDFILTIGNDALEADFLMTSESTLGDTLYIIELSNLPLDSMQWNYNQEVFLNFTENTDPDYLLRLKSFETGIYNIALKAYSGGCMATQTKQVEIIEISDTSDSFSYVGYDPLIKSLEVSPNPTDREFIAIIELREVADIQFTIYSVVTGNIVDVLEEEGYDYYELSYDLYGMQSGLYVIIVTASNERKQTKLIFK